MKKIILTLLLSTSILAGFTATAGGDSLNQQATELTRKYSNQLGLNEARFLQLRRVVYAQLVATADVKTQYANDAALREQKLQELQTEFTTKLKTILNEAQYARLMSLPSTNTLAIAAPTAQP